MRFEKKYLFWGLTAFAVVCRVLVFYDTVFQRRVLLLYLRRLLDILAPVFYGFFMAYLLTPVVNWFERRLFSRRGGGRWARPASILLCWVLVAAGFYVLLRILLPQLYGSILTLAGNAEGYYRNVVQWLQRFLEDNPVAERWLTGLVREYYQDAAAWLRDTLLPQTQSILTALTTGVVDIVTFLADLLVGTIVSVYLLSTKEKFAATGCKLAYAMCSEKRAAWLIRGVKAVDRIFSRFFRGKLLDSMVVGLLCFLFSSLLQFPYAPLISVVVAVTDLIPFFGPFLGAIPSALLILLDSPIKCLYFVVMIVVLQQLDGNILAPKILGESTGLSSFWVIVAILVGGGLGGILGMFIGVPTFACLYTGIRHFAAWRLEKKGLPIHSYNYRTHRPVTDEELGRSPGGPGEAAPGKEEPAPEKRDGTP